ncbi:hypothetical protein T439DRAFT_346037 [Meredithblackwellia eburnea MCA 4105]
MSSLPSPVSDNNSPSSTASTTVNSNSKKRGTPVFAHSIQRGKACLQCRSKKLKCDGIQPSCSNCNKAMKSRNDQHSLCEYEDYQPGEKRRRVSSKQMSLLEHKLAELQRKADQILASNPRPPTPDSDFVTPNDRVIEIQNLPHQDQGTSSRSRGSFIDSFPPGFDETFNFVLNQHLLPSPPTTNTLSSSTSPSNSSSQHPSPSDRPPGPPTTASSGVTVEQAGTSLSVPLTRTPTNTPYPPGLPSPTALHTIISTVLHSPHPVEALFTRKAHFLRRVNLSYLHRDFPSSSLLYAFVGLAIELFGTNVLLGAERPEDKVKTDYARRILCKEGGAFWDENPGQWFIDQAKETMAQSIARGEKLFDQTFAVTVIGHYYHRICMFTDIWTLTGDAVRMCALLGLNKPHEPSLCLPPSRNREEENERRNLLWWSVCGNRFSSANTGWAIAMYDEDVLTLLPPATNSAATAEKEWRALSHWSPEFFSFHPPELVGGVQIFFKCMFLLGKCVTLPMRCPVFGHPLKQPPADLTPQVIRSRADFVQLTQNIEALTMSTAHFPLTDPTSTWIPLIETAPHACTILLHENLCSSDRGDVSLTQCVDAAIRITGSLKFASSAGASFELLPWIDFFWVVAGRTFVRALAVRQLWGDEAGVTDFRRKIENIIYATESYHTLHSDNVVSVLRNLYENPSICLPQLNSAAPNPERTSFHDEKISLQAMSTSLGLLHAEQRATLERLNRLD